MNHYYRIYTEVTDPDNGLKNIMEIARIDSGFKRLAEDMHKMLTADVIDNPNIDVYMQYTESNEIPAKLGNFVYDCLSTKKTKYGNDQTLGNATRLEYLKLK